MSHITKTGGTSETKRESQARQNESHKRDTDRLNLPRMSLTQNGWHPKTTLNWSVENSGLNTPMTLTSSVGGLANRKNPSKGITLFDLFDISFFPWFLLRASRVSPGFTTGWNKTLNKKTPNLPFLFRLPNDASIPSMTRPSTTCFPFNLLWSPGRHRSRLAVSAERWKLPPSRSKNRKTFLPESWFSGIHGSLQYWFPFMYFM